MIILDYDKRIIVWRKLTDNIIRDYKKLLVEIIQAKKLNIKLRAGDRKIVSTNRIRKRAYIDFCRLSSGNHNKYQECRDIYVNFIDEIEKIENRLEEIEQKYSKSLLDSLKSASEDLIFYKESNNLSSLLTKLIESDGKIFQDLKPYLLPFYRR